MHTRSSRSGVRRILWILAAVAMIVAVMPLAGSAANEVGNERVVDLIADGGADFPAVPVDVGDAIIWDDGVNLYVNYEIDTLLPDTWCITKTHIAVALMEPDIPQTKQGNPIPGLFEFTGVYDLCETSIPIVIPMEEDWQNAGTLAIAVHANVEVPGGLDAVELILPAQATMSYAHPGGDSYFNITLSNGLTGTYDGWCVDVGHNVANGLVNVSSSYDPGADFGNIDNPANLPYVNWLINNYAVGDIAMVDGLPFTMGDIQRAIWMLVDNTLSTAGLGPWTVAHATELYDAALANGEGFEPGCDEKVAIILSSTNTVKQTTIYQTTFFELGVPCESRTETAWGGDWDFDEWEFEYDFTSKKWAGYFMYDVGPVD